jgi:diguanylate cyclase (GGDEF)-like protein/PAS domain S-box-containing protein
MLYQRLLGSAEALQKIIDIIPSPVFVKDTEHRWVLVNAALEQAIGRPRAELLGKSDYDMFPPEEAAAFWGADDAVFASGQTSEAEETFTSAAGETRVIVTRKTLLRVGAGRGTLFIVGIMADVTSYHEAAAQSRFLSHHDELTGLPNRLLFHDRLRDAVGQGQRALDQIAVLLVDLDGFKAVNDAYGHAAGDEMLRVVARRLIEVVREGDTVARLGGDEFGILLRGGPEIEIAVQRVAEALCTSVAQPVKLGGSQARVTASVGITFLNRPETAPDELLRQADTAMYSVKRSGRHGHRNYEPALELAASRQLHADLHQALERRQLHVVYQPLWNPPDGELTGYEALLRWEHPHHGAIAPAVFIPIAEESGLIAAYGNFVLRAACRTARRWPERVRIAVNVSPSQLVSNQLCQDVVAILSETGLPAWRLELEVAEQHTVTSRSGTIEALQQLRAAGVRIALDDFGTGPASLDMMHRFAFDRLKIDGRFVANLPKDPRGHAIVASLVNLAHDLGAQVTAEGVERVEQAFCLMELGCDEMQGYLFGHPNAPASVL